MTLEQVDKLRAMANISFEEAKAALDAANGDLLEAIIYLEKQGKLNPPSGGGYYSSEKIVDANIVTCKTGWEKQNKSSSAGESFTSLLKKIGRFCLKMIHKGNINSFEVLKGGESKASFPVTALVLLLIFAFWIIIPLIIVGLFFGLRYRFHGPDFSGTTVNEAMNSAADAAENLKNSIINQKN